MFKIVRVYFNDAIPARTIKRGLTEAEAQEHCRHPEASSSTCQTVESKNRTQKLGAWMDTYQECRK